MALSVRTKLMGAIGAATLVAGLLAAPGVSQAEETFSQVGAIGIPGLASFDISWVDSTVNFSNAFGNANGYYFLSDRSNKEIAFVNLGTGGYAGYKNGNFVGAVGTPVNNDLSGPNGVLTFNNTASGAGPEIWSGDGPGINVGCPSYLNGTCSAVKVMAFNAGGGNNGQLTHVIVTNGAARADELCHDPVDNLVMIANDAEADFKFGTPFVTWISTSTYKVVAQMTIPQATNGIEQCKYDADTGKFFINLPEVNGPGNDTAPGNVLVITPPTAGNSFTPSVVATYIIPTADCAGPQGMAIGPDTGAIGQLLLGCNAVGPNGVQNSIIIDKRTGALQAIGWGLGGADEVWYNPGDGHYYITGASLPTPTLAVVDAQGAAGCNCTGSVDQIIPTPAFAGAKPHSVAGGGNYLGANPNSFFVPVAGGLAVFAPSGTDADDVPSAPSQE